MTSVQPDILVTGASSFLGYHVAKRLNEQGSRPRVLELPGSDLAALDRLDVSRCEGHLGDAAAVAAACAGVGTILHLAFKVSAGGGAALLAEMRATNIGGTARLLDAAAAAGVSRVVVASSALTIGVNHEARPLDEQATWEEHALDLPYALIRREAEQHALAMAAPGFSVVAVCPAFTMGPDDPVGAPANTLIRKVMTGKQRFTLPVGFGCLDVRDFADGAIAAAQRGVAGQRYLLWSGVRGRTGAREQGGSANPWTLRVVRHVARSPRTRLGAAPAPPNARGHDPLAAGRGSELTGDGRARLPRAGPRSCRGRPPFAGCVLRAPRRRLPAAASAASRPQWRASSPARGRARPADDRRDHVSR